MNRLRRLSCLRRGHQWAMLRRATRGTAIVIVTGYLPAHEAQRVRDRVKDGPATRPGCAECIRCGKVRTL